MPCNSNARRAPLCSSRAETGTIDERRSDRENIQDKKHRVRTLGSSHDVRDFHILQSERNKIFIIELQHRLGTRTGDKRSAGSKFDDISFRSCRCTRVSHTKTRACHRIRDIGRTRERLHAQPPRGKAEAKHLELPDLHVHCHSDLRNLCGNRRAASDNHSWKMRTGN